LRLEKLIDFKLNTVYLGLAFLEAMYLAHAFPVWLSTDEGIESLLIKTKIQRDRASLDLSSLYVYSLWTSGRVQCTYMYLEVCIEMASGIDVLGLFLGIDEMALDMKIRTIC
jgi:hypothetical protein